MTSAHRNVLYTLGAYQVPQLMLYALLHAPAFQMVFHLAIDNVCQISLVLLELICNISLFQFFSLRLSYRSNPIRHVYMGSWSFDHPVRFQGCHSSADRVLASKFTGVSKPTHRIGILALTLAIFISSKVLA